MTPERRREVGERLKLYKSGTPCKPQAAFADVLRLFGETLADNDALTAEIATLRTRLDALVTAGEKVLLRIDGTFYTESINSDGDVDALSAAVREAKGEK